MPAQNPRIDVFMNNLIYQDVRLSAEKDNVSLSAKVRDLLKEAMEIQEDIVLSGFAEKREKSWNDSKALSHDDVWS
jgi:alkyl hydroperoxide reductase subunit AhpF